MKLQLYMFYQQEEQGQHIAFPVPQRVGKKKFTLRGLRWFGEVTIKLKDKYVKNLA